MVGPLLFLSVLVVFRQPKVCPRLHLTIETSIAKLRPETSPGNWIVQKTIDLYKTDLSGRFTKHLPEMKQAGWFHETACFKFLGVFHKTPP